MALFDVFEKKSIKVKVDKAQSGSIKGFVYETLTSSTKLLAQNKLNLKFLLVLY